MNRAFLAALLLSAAPAAAQQSIAKLPPPVVADPRVERLRDDALANDHYAWDIVEALTTEVGQRLAATEAEARARDWAVKRLTAMGFANVHVEPFTMPVWTRGAESAEIVAPFPQKLVLTALGNSGATPEGGTTAQIVGFPSLEALKTAPDDQVRGKIVFVWHRMAATQDGSAYGYFGQIRRAGPALASKKGAVAILIRSIGTDEHRLPHTGVTSWVDGAQPIPAAQGQSGALAVGTVGFAWRDVIINKSGSVIEWFIDGLKICSVTNALTSSNIFVGYWDPFTSLSDNTNLSFGLVDNLRVVLSATYDAGDSTKDFGYVRVPPIVQLEEELSFYTWDDKRLMTDCLFSLALACWSGIEEAVGNVYEGSVYGS